MPRKGYKQTQEHIINNHKTNPLKSTTRKCLTCEKEFKILISRVNRGDGKYCSSQCCPRGGHQGHKHSTKTKEKMSKNRTGSKNANWKGGRKTDKDSYILSKNFTHPFSNSQNYVREHRLVMEKHICRYLLPEEVVHHRGIKYPINSTKNKQDNRIENLQLFPNEAEHQRLHAKTRVKKGVQGFTKTYK